MSEFDEARKQIEQSRIAAEAKKKSETEAKRALEKDGLQNQVEINRSKTLFDQLKGNILAILERTNAEVLGGGRQNRYLARSPRGTL